MLIGTSEATLNYIPFTSVWMDEQPYRYRHFNPEAVITLESSLIRSGQTHPTTLLEISPDKFLVLDGHRRCDAIRRIRENGGTWEKILAHVIPYDSFSVLDRFRLLTERNDRGENSYGLVERGQFFRDFLVLGMRVPEIARECGLAAHTVEDLIELSHAHSELATLLNLIDLEPSLALMLHHRFQGWIRSSHAALAGAVARRLLEYASQEKITMKSWRFLLDFYWSESRPFMAPAS